MVAQHEKQQREEWLPVHAVALSGSNVASPVVSYAVTAAPATSYTASSIVGANR